MSEPVVRAPERFLPRIDVQRARLERMSAWVERLKSRRVPPMAVAPPVSGRDCNGS